MVWLLVRHHHKRQPTVRWHVPKELCQRFQAAGGGANPNHRAWRSRRRDCKKSGRVGIRRRRVGRVIHLVFVIRHEV
jgi:hypothetical protein